MLRIALLLCITCLMNSAFAQFLSAPEVKELKEQLQNSSADSNKVELLLKYALHHHWKAGATDADLDSALGFARKAEQLSLKLRYQRGIGKSYWIYSQALREHGDTEKGMNAIDKAINLFKQCNCMVELGDAFVEKRLYYSAFASNEELASRIYYTEQALEVFKKADNVLKQGNCLHELGDLFGLQGKSSKAIEVLSQAVQAYQRSDQTIKLYGVYDLLGAAYADVENFPEAVRYGLLAAKGAEEAGDSTQQLTAIYNRLSMTYYYMGDLNNAGVYDEKALASAERNNDVPSIRYIAGNTSRLFVRQQKPNEALKILQRVVSKYYKNGIYPSDMSSCLLDVYVNLHDLQRAKTMYNQLAVSLKSEENLNSTDRLNSYRSMVHYLFAVKRYKEAEEYLAMRLELASGVSLRTKLIMAHYHLWAFKLDSVKSNFPSAINHLHLHKLYSDSLKTEASNKQIAQLNIQYDTEKKDQQLKINKQNIELLTKQGQLQEASLVQEHLIRNMTIGGACVLLLLLGLLYNRYRLKKRSNQLLQEQQNEISEKNVSLQHLLEEKDWLVKEIHHRVKNNFQVVTGLLGTQASYLKNAEAVSAIAESQHRIESMSMIHQKLYQSENLSLVNFSDFIHELTDYLLDALNVSDKIRVIKNIKNIELDLSRSIPIGLILNEAITNAIKYAFIGKPDGEIKISLIQSENNCATLSIMDNGVGLPPGFDISKTNSMGMNLMKGLGQEINGIFKIESNPNQGTRITISFTNI